MSEGKDAALAPDARLLLVRLSALGDIVFALPALAAARSLTPGGRIEWLVEDRHADLLAGHPQVDALHVFPRSRWREAKGLAMVGAASRLAGWFRGLSKLGAFDAILDFQGNLKSGMHLRFLASERKLGFDRPAAKEGAWRFLDQRIPDPGRVHRAERDLRLVRELGFRGPMPIPQRWPLEEKFEGEMSAALAGGERVEIAGAGGGPDPLVLLHTTVTRYGRDKAWPQERWVELTRKLAGLGADVRLLWTPADRNAVQTMVERTGRRCRLAPATPSLVHLMALTDRAAALVGTDSGPVHLAAVRGTPVVALFGPTDPVRYAPLGPRVAVVSARDEGQEPPPRDRSRRSPLMDDIASELPAQRVEAFLSGPPAARAGQDESPS